MNRRLLHRLLHSLGGNRASDDRASPLPPRQARHFYFRKRVPAEVRDAYPPGRKEFVVSPVASYKVQTQAVVVRAATCGHDPFLAGPMHSPA